MNDLVAQLRIDVERRRQWLVFRHAERRAVRKHTGDPTQPQLADREQIAFELELRHTPRMAAQRMAAVFDVALEITVVLLQMLGSQEQTLGPDDLAVS